MDYLLINTGIYVNKDVSLVIASFLESEDIQKIMFAFGMRDSTTIAGKYPLMMCAAGSNSIEIAEWASKNKRKMWNVSCSIKAIENHSKDILDWAEKRYGHDEVYEKDRLLLAKLCSVSSIYNIEKIVPLLGRSNSYICEAAVKSRNNCAVEKLTRSKNQVLFLKAIYGHSDLDFSNMDAGRLDRIAFSLGFSGNLELIKVFFEKFPLYPLSRYMTSSAAFMGHIHLLQWLLPSMDFRTTCLAACKRGKVEVLEWAVSHGYKIKNTSIGAEAARQENLECLKFLVEVQGMSEDQILNKCLGLCGFGCIQYLIGKCKSYTQEQLWLSLRDAKRYDVFCWAIGNGYKTGVFPRGSSLHDRIILREYTGDHSRCHCCTLSGKRCSLKIFEDTGYCKRHYGELIKRGCEI